MKIYIASLRGSGYSLEVDGYFKRDSTPFEKKILRNTTNILESYLYMDKKENSLIKQSLIKGRKIMLDSGAFTAKHKGVEINIDDYIKFVYKYKDSFKVVVNLDVIGDPKATMRNQRIMEENGIRPLPVYHISADNKKFLKYYVDNYPYVGIGGIRRMKSNRIFTVLDDLWGNVILDSKGKPRTRIHGFAITRLSPLWRYPWHSIDSSAWVKQSGAGALPVYSPEYFISKQLDKIRLYYVTERTQFRHREHQHIDNALPRDRKELIHQIRTAGFSLKRLRKSHLARACYHLAYYQWVETFFTEFWKNNQPNIAHTQRSIFDV